MAEENFYDADFDEENSEVILPPSIQWINGDGAPWDEKTAQGKPEVFAVGGFELPIDRFGHVAHPDEPVYNVPHSGGTFVQAYLAKELHFAILAVGQKAWFWFGEDRERHWMPPNFERKQGQKISSRTRIYALCQELENEPVILTFSGTGSKEIDKAIGDFKRKVIGPATRLAAKKSGKARATFPLYAFWLSLRAGAIIAFDTGSTATPPAMSKEIYNQEDLQKAYVGQEIINIAEAEKNLADNWAKQEKDYALNGPTQINEASQPASLPPPVWADGQVPEDNLAPAKEAPANPNETLTANYQDFLEDEEIPF